MVVLKKRKNSIEETPEEEFEITPMDETEQLTDRVRNAIGPLTNSLPEQLSDEDRATTIAYLEEEKRVEQELKGNYGFDNIEVSAILIINPFERIDIRTLRNTPKDEMNLYFKICFDSFSRLNLTNDDIVRKIKQRYREFKYLVEDEDTSSEFNDTEMYKSNYAKFWKAMEKGTTIDNLPDDNPYDYLGLEFA